MLEQHRFALLEIGAAGRLLVSGELQEVLPLDGHLDRRSVRSKP
ncbi:MAG TPA: hypothetical protein VG099_27495 [Gemmataceae bacterium]|jgi:hypothetical protein|nr:hypothetical protein [Gemmataceae bacterium]